MSEKQRPKVEAVVGEPVTALTMVVPPGAALYKHYSPKRNAASILGGPLVSAFLSKKMKQVEGLAGQVPRQVGFLALTASSLVHVSVKNRFGIAPGDVLATWPRSEVTITFQDGGKRRYHALTLEFSDGSQSAVFGEDKWDLGAFAEAAG